MKVRVKGHEVAFEVVEESANFYILKDNFADRGGKFLGAKADYEPVEEWVVVTNECAVHKEHGYIWFSYNDKTCGNLFYPGTRIVVDALGGIRIEALR